MDGGLPSQSPIFYILWSGLYFSKKQNGNHFMWAINLFIGLSPTSSKSTTNSSLASLSLATVSFPSEFELGELIVNNWPFPPFTLPCTCSYTLFTEICDERGRKYNYIVGRVVWVAGLVALPFVGLWNIFILWKKNFFDEYTFSAKSLGDWYYFGMVSVSMNIVFVFLHPFLPESPRWLISQKRFSEAAELINRIRWDKLFVSF